MGAFTMPSLGADMDRGRLIEWLVRPGDTVHRGDLVAVVDTAKSEIEVETFEEGVVGELLVEPGTEVPVGTPLATLLPIRAGAGAEVAPAAVTPPEPAAAEPGRPKPVGRRREPAAPPATTPAPRPVEEPAVIELAVEEPAVVEPAAAVPAGPREPAPRHTAAPLVRRLAAEHGLDIARIHATGPEGRVTREDVERAAAQLTVRVKVSPQARRLAADLGVDLTLLTPGDDGVVRAEHVRRAASSMAQAGALESAAPPGPPGPPPTPPPAVPAPATAAATDMRTAIARLMARSKREIPHYYLSTTVDLGGALDWMRDRNKELPVEQRLVPAALVLKAIALAVRQRPEVNGYWVDDAFVPGPGVHLGVAISLRGGGLVAPAIHDAPDLALVDLMGALRDLVGRARAGRLRRAELADPTLTVTNLGDQGVEAVHGVIYPPQVALVGVGRVVERPWAVGGLIGVRPVTTLTLAADHRATDGFTGARFLDAIDRLLQEPEAL
jgi:pyruvate dehydrogenase E2 component (dihydrolipoamide acetyltransferase)